MSFRCLQSKRRKIVLQRARQVLGFLLANWYKLVILGLVITMIVLVSIHVSILLRMLRSEYSEFSEFVELSGKLTWLYHAFVQGFSVFGSILSWFKNRNGWGGWGVYVGFYTGIVALFFPGVVFIMGAGFVFGFWRGLLAVWIGGAVGQALSFLLARYLLRDWVESFVQSKWKRWKYIDAALENDGWKLVLIMRLSPIIPYNLLNIAMATTSMHFWSFAFVSAIGIVFEGAVFCYIGTMADNITSIVSGQAEKTKAIQCVLLGLSIVMCIIGAFFVSIMVRRAIKKAEELAIDDLDADERESRVYRLDTLSPERFMSEVPDTLSLSSARTLKSSKLGAKSSPPESSELNDQEKGELDELEWNQALSRSSNRRRIKTESSEDFDL